MAINSTPKKMPAGDGNPTAGYAIKIEDSPTPSLEDKAYWTTRAGFARKGYALHSSNPADGTVNPWAEHCGLIGTLRVLVATRQFLDQIGGCHDL